MLTTILISQLPGFYLGSADGGMVFWAVLGHRLLVCKVLGVFSELGPIRSLVAGAGFTRAQSEEGTRSFYATGSNSRVIKSE